MAGNITELRRLIVGPEVDEVSDQVGDIRKRLDSVDARARDVREVLPQIIMDGGDDLYEALQEPVAAAMQRSIEKNTDQIADLLFPVMGPAIRRAIAEAINSMMKSVNEMLEATLTVRGLKWRIESLRTGLPYAEVALNHTLVYRVEQVFLIHNESGVLVKHTAAPGVLARDSDSVSAMFTAIQDFVRHSFADSQTDSLREIEVGGQTVWSVSGPYAMLVVVVRGIPPNAMRGRLLGVLERIHAKHGRALRVLSDDQKPMPGLESQLDECIELEFQSSQRDRGMSGPKPKRGEKRVLSQNMIYSYVLVTVLALALTYFWYSNWRANQQRVNAVAVIDATPGIVVTGYNDNDGRLVVEGLGDPLAQVDIAALGDTGIDPASVDYALDPYQSLDKPIVVLRARRLLRMPPSVIANLGDDGALRLRGTATKTWLEQARETEFAIAGINMVDFSALKLQP